MKWYQITNYFISLVVICSPLSALPALLSLTHGRGAKERRRTGAMAGLAVGVILIVVTWIGSPLLQFFGIGVPAFQFAGGVIVFLVALSMLNAETSRMNRTLEDEQEAKHRESIVVVPLATPLMAGPGAISTVVVAVNNFPGTVNQVYMTLCAIAVGLFFSGLLFFGFFIEKCLRRTGIQIINRIGGLILAALAAEMLAKGAIGLFPVLAGTH